VKIGLVGGTGRARSKPFNDERTINLIPIVMEGAREPSMLLGSPGLGLFATAGAGAIREMFFSANGRAFVVSLNQLYEITSGGAANLLGTLLTSTGNVTMAENPTQLAICDGTYGYILTYATNAFSQITDVDFPSAGTLDFIDGYFAVNKNNTGQFYISSLNDGLNWAALDFATAESSPDDLRRVINGLGQLWLMGRYTTEIWTNTGASPFPFQRIAGAVIQVGIAAPFTALNVGNTLFWVGQDRQGRGVVYAAKGFTPQRVSNEAVEILIQSATDIDTMKAFSYQQDGHVYYCLTGGGLTTSLVLDLTTQIWHERAYAPGASYEQWLANSHMFAFGYNLVGDRRNGNIYRMSLDIYDDNGDAITRERTFNHLSDEGQRIRLNSLEIAMETGVGLASGATTDTDPVCQLEVSRDGGQTWLGSWLGYIGKIGEYTKKVAFRRLGVHEVCTFRLKIATRTKVALIGAYLT